MKPKTKVDHRILEIKLRPLNKKQIKFGFRRPVYFCSIKYKTAECLECNHQWKVPHYARELIKLEKETKCPNCKKNLRYTNLFFINDEDNTCVIDSAAEFVIIRYFKFERLLSRGKPPSFHVTELFQYWYSEKWAPRFIGKRSSGFNSYLTGDFVLRKYNGNSIDLHETCLYQNYKIPEILKKRGFVGQFYGNSVAQFIEKVLTNSKIETILKWQAYEMLHHKFLYFFTTTLPWTSVKILLKNKYNKKLVDEETLELYRDYINMIDALQYDIQSPKYLMPENIRNAHRQALLETRRKNQREEERLGILNEAAEAAKIRRYNRKMAKLKELVISEGNIIIKPLLTVSMIRKEEAVMDHCVYSNKYYRKASSYLFTSYVNGQPAETLEYDHKLKTLVQHGGYDNTHVPECEQIQNLFNNNIKTIEDCINLHKKRNANTRPPKLSANRKFEAVAACNHI